MPVVCKICGFESFSHLQSHLVWKHKITPKQYLKKFPDSSWYTEEWLEKMNAARRRNANTSKALQSKSSVGKKNKGMRRTPEFCKSRSEQYSGEQNPFYGKHHSLETKVRLSCHFRGISEEEFDDFTKPESIRQTKSGAFKTWRKLVFERDNYTCLLCEKRGGDLEPHHIIPRRDDPGSIYKVENGATLCKECHKKTFKKEYEFVVSLIEKIERRVAPFQLS